MSKSRKSATAESRIAYMAVGVIGVSIITMLITLILTLFNVPDKPALLAQLPLIGLPVGFLLIILLLIVSVVRRSKANRN
jgi:hypothetical protein